MCVRAWLSGPAWSQRDDCVRGFAGIARGFSGGGAHIFVCVVFCGPGSRVQLEGSAILCGNK